MLISSNRNQGESLTVELFRESLVNLLVEVGSLRGTATSENFDEKVFQKFKSVLDQTKQKSGNTLSECHALYKIVSKYQVNGKNIDQLDVEAIKQANKDELFTNLQTVYNGVKLFSESLRSSASSSLFLVS